MTWPRSPSRPTTWTPALCAPRSAGISVSFATSYWGLAPQFPLRWAHLGALLWVFHASEALFHTGWFVESLAIQTLVLFVIRTAGHPWQSRPSLALATTTLLIVLIGLQHPVHAPGRGAGLCAAARDVFSVPRRGDPNVPGARGSGQASASAPPARVSAAPCQRGTRDIVVGVCCLMVSG